MPKNTPDEGFNEYRSIGNFEYRSTGGFDAQFTSSVSGESFDANHAYRNSQLTQSEGLAWPGQSTLKAPLRNIIVGPCLIRGGAEQWLINLARFVNPKRLHLLKTVVTNPTMVDPEFTADLPIPFEVGQHEAIQKATDECDVLISWGLPMDDLLVDGVRS